VSNPLGIHTMVWTADWSESAARVALEKSKRAGYDFVEIPLLDPTTVDAAMTKRLLAEYELDAGCSLGLTFDTDISGTDPEAVARGERLLHDALAVTRDIGGRYMGGVIHSAMAKYLTPATEAGRDNAIRVLAGLAATAAESGITIGLEVVNRYESNLINTADQAVALAEAIGADNVVVHLDTYHANIEEDDLARAIARCGDRLGYVHCGESHRGYLGTGSIDWPHVFDALVESGYAGPIAFESFSSAVLSDAFVAALALWRRPWEDSYDVASHAHEFLVDGLAAARAARARAAK
jgi:D-psicose/D-tagatose/L-ribulose 3-epimerase